MKKVVVSLLAIIVLVSLSVVPTFAAESPATDPVAKVTIVTHEGVSVTADPAMSEVAVGETVTFTTNVEDGFEFVQWIIEGNYELVSGDLSASGPITITVNGDVNVDVEVTGETQPTAPTGDTHTSPTAPQTGTTEDVTATIIMSVAVVALLGAGFIIVAKKRA